MVGLSLGVCWTQQGALHKTAESIEVPFQMWTWVVLRNHVLGGGADPSKGRDNFEETYPAPL